MRKRQTVFDLIGEYVDDPYTFFAFRLTCRGMSSAVSPKFPVSTDQFLTLCSEYGSAHGIEWQAEPRLHRHLVIVSATKGSSLSEFLDVTLNHHSSLHAHVNKALYFTGFAKLARTDRTTLRALAHLVMKGEFPVHADMVFRACSSIGSLFSFLPMAFREVKSVEALLSFSRKREDLGEEILACARRGGNRECIKVALKRAAMGVQSSAVSANDVVPVEAPTGGIDTSVSAVSDGNLVCVETPSAGIGGHAHWDSAGEDSSSAISEGHVNHARENLVRNAQSSGALLNAVRAGNVFVCKLLLDMGLPANGPSAVICDFPLLILAKRRPAGPNDIAIARLLIERGAKAGYGLLTEALCRGNYALSDVLLAAGGVTSAAEVFGFRAKAPLKCLDWLSDKGIDIAARDDRSLYGYAITAAAAGANLSALRNLTKRGIPVNVRGGLGGHTPLTALLDSPVFQCKQAVACVELLLAQCPSLATTTTVCGVNPMFFAEVDLREWARVADARAIADLLLANGATPNPEGAAACDCRTGTCPVKRLYESRFFDL